MVIGQKARVRSASRPETSRSPVAEEFAEPRHHADRRARRAQNRQVRSEDPARALVRGVGEEAHHPYQDDEPQGAALCPGRHAG